MTQARVLPGHRLRQTCSLLQLLAVTLARLIRRINLRHRQSRTRLRSQRPRRVTLRRLLFPQPRIPSRRIPMWRNRLRLGSPLWTRATLAPMRPPLRQHPLIPGKLLIRRKRHSRHEHGVHPRQVLFLDRFHECRAAISKRAEFFEHAGGIDVRVDHFSNAAHSAPRLRSTGSGSEHECRFEFGADIEFEHDQRREQHHGKTPTVVKLTVIDLRLQPHHRNAALAVAVADL